MGILTPRYWNVGCSLGHCVMGQWHMLDQDSSEWVKQGKQLLAQTSYTTGKELCWPQTETGHSSYKYILTGDFFLISRNARFCSSSFRILVSFKWLCQVRSVNYGEVCMLSVHTCLYFAFCTLCCPNANFSHGKFGSIFPRKASCNRVELPNHKEL